MRQTAKSTCCQCLYESNQRRRREQPEIKRRDTYRWREKHPEVYDAINKRGRPRQAVYMRERRARDPQFRLTHVLRCRLGKFLRGDCRISAVRDLGCTVAELVAHLEAQFQPGMTWDNYGRRHTGRSWEIDHIKPLLDFDLTDPQQARSAVHFTNLQPLWREDNIAKRERDKALRG